MSNNLKKVKIHNNNINYILKTKKRNGPNVSVVFFCGLKSNIAGTKANYLKKLQKKYGFEYLTFDYSGHGKSSGNINECIIEDWLNECLTLIKYKTKYPLILIGSSMGGWLAFLVAKYTKKKIKGIVGIATAADFTKEIVKKLSIKEKLIYFFFNKIFYSSPYEKEKFIFSKKFMKNSQKFFLLDKKLVLDTEIILLYGRKDEVVNIKTQLNIVNTIDCKNLSLNISKDSDHRMSSVKDLKIIERKLIYFF